jgi:hypothetical protein
MRPFRITQFPLKKDGILLEKQIPIIRANQQKPDFGQLCRIVWARALNLNN